MMEAAKTKKNVKRMLLFSFILLFWAALHGTFVHAEKGEDAHRYETNTQVYEEHGESEDDEYEDQGEYRGGDRESEHEDDGYENEHQAVTESPAASPTPSPAPVIKPTPKATAKPAYTYKDGATAGLLFQDSDQPLKVTVAVRGGTPLVPADAVLNHLQIPFVQYSKGTLLEVYVNGRQLIFHTGKKVFYEDGVKKSIAAAPFSKGQHYYVPLNVLADELKYSVKWNPQTNAFDLKRGI